MITEGTVDSRNVKSQRGQEKLKIKKKRILRIIQML